MKQVLVSKQEGKLNAKQKIIQHTLQKQLSMLKLQEVLILSSFVIGGVLGRTLMQPLPSVEPITFFAVLAGALFGKKKGAFIGGLTWFLSNFFMFGGQGPWSALHVLAGLVAGYLGGFLEKKAGYIKTIIVFVIATLFFEVTMNISSGFFFGFGILLSFLTAIPFMLVHLFSNVVFSLLIPSTKKLIEEKGMLNEKELYKTMLKRLQFWRPKDE
jgi:energy-coupling factor transport system substrate-specific component